MNVPATATAAPHKWSIRRSLVWFNRNLMLRGVYDIICGGSMFTFVAFALAAGIAPEKVGRCASAASLGCLFQLLALPLLGRVRSRKRFIVTLGLIEPVVLLMGVMMVPLLPPSMRLSVLVGAVFVAAAFMHMTKPAADDWVASTVPQSIRGRFVGRRNQLLSIALMITMLVVGQIGDRISKTNAWGFAGILVAGAICGLLSIIALTYAPAPPRQAAEHMRLMDLPDVMKDRRFRHYMIGLTIFTLPFLMAVPYYQVYQQSVLVMKPSWIAAVAILYHLIRIPISSPLGLLADRWGPRRMALLAGAIYAVFFVILISATSQRLWPMFAAWAIAAVGDSVYNIAQVAALYGAVPPRGARPAFFAVSNLITMGLYAVGPVFAEPLLHALRDVNLTLGPWALGRYHLMYILCGLLMIPCTFGSMLYIGKRSPTTGP